MPTSHREPVLTPHHDSHKPLTNTLLGTLRPTRIVFAAIFSKTHK
jgi:hypothetical protein